MKSLTFTLVSLILSTTLKAQQTDKPIEQLTVTATRQQAAIADISGNISWLDQASLQQISHEHINQALVRIPGSWISRGNGQEHLTAIRSPVLTGAGGCGAFFIAQDGISARAPGFCNANQLFDLNTEQAGRIEVVRGPASLSYGTNAVHGVINVLTPDAFNLHGLAFSADAGPHDYLRSKLSLAKRGQQHALLALANLTHDGGYKDASGFDQQKLGFIHQYRQAQLTVKNVLALSNLNQETAGFIRGFAAYRDPLRKRQNPNPEAFRDNQSARLYSIIEYQPNDINKLRLIPYVRWADMQFLQHFLPWQPLEHNRQHSVGLQAQYQWDFDEASLVTGLDWDSSTGELQETQFDDFSPSIPAGQHYDYRVSADIYSPFVRASWQASANFNLNAGVRFEHTDYDYHNRLSDGSACAPNVDNCRFTRPGDQAVSYQEWSYQAGINYALSDSQRLYAQLSRGYRAPQATELFRLQQGQNIADLDAEHLTSVEMGWRGQWQGLFFDLNGFDMGKDQVIFQDTQRQNISGGSTSHRGIEIAVQYSLPKGLYLSANATLARHKYDSNLTISRENIQGKLIDTAPKHMGSLQLGWRGETGHNIELEWVHLGRYFLNPENTAEYPGHDLLNLRANWQATTNLGLQLRLINLTDQDYAERADFAFGQYRYFVGEPRAMYLGISYQLD